LYIIIYLFILAIFQEAARGIRICAEFGSPNFKPFINSMLFSL
jgi:hypothetical protein